MRLYIAEKPSLGRAIAEALPKPHQRGEGFIRVGNGDIVSWCIGHLLEQVEPEEYDPALKKWSHENLPIIPNQWKLRAKKQTAKQLGVLKKLIKQADQLVHAGDPDREGQLLVDEVIDFIGVPASKREQVQRCLISDLNLPAVKRSLNSLRNNREFAPLSVSALARSRADWLYGINLTRAYTLQGQKVGYKGVLSVGRVQTPILGLVVNRDKEIANFVSKPFYNVWTNITTEANELFRAKWQPSEHCAAYLDEQGRNLSRPLAENVISRISFQPGTVTQVSHKKKSPSAPLPHNLSSLQIDANKMYGLGAQQVLDICQSLYEKHKAITYPRSDSRHLPVEHFHQAPSVLTTIANNLDQVSHQPLSIRENNATLFSHVNTQQKSKAWNDAKVDAHHAIIPTEKKLNKLSEQEAKVYRLVCRNYVAQFLPAHIYTDTRIELEIAGGKFIAKAKNIEQEGWKALFTSANQQSKSNENKSNDNDDADLQYNLPSLQKGQTVQSQQAELEEKHTTPPKHFTEATLLSAMTGISNFVKTPELKKILKETDGLGTEATRAGIIELLFKRGFMARTGKTIKATDAGKALIEALPDSTTSPDRTAHWESILSSISQRQAKYDTLMTPLEKELTTLVTQSQSVVPSGLKGVTALKPSYKKRRKTTRRKTSSNKTSNKKGAGVNSPK